LRACNAVKRDAEAQDFEAGIKAAAAIHKRASRVRVSALQEVDLAVKQSSNKID